MPVILASEQRDRWLDPSMQDAATAIALLKTFDSNLMGR
jgi:putative SOS response-associated peptidase YedK